MNMSPSPDTTEAVFRALIQERNDDEVGIPTDELLTARAIAADRKALEQKGYAIVKRVSRADLERAYEIAYGEEPDPHDAAVLLVAKRYIFGESLELKI